MVCGLEPELRMWYRYESLPHSIRVSGVEGQASEPYDFRFMELAP